MSEESKKPSTKAGKKVGYIRKTAVNKKLLSIHFDDHQKWLDAYRSHDEQLVARSLIAAFKKRYFMASATAAKKLGVSPKTLYMWENGLSSIRWRTKNELVTAGWFVPKHFGLDVTAEEFNDDQQPSAPERDDAPC